MNNLVYVLIACVIVIYPLGILLIVNDGDRFMSLMIIIVLIIIPFASYQAIKEVKK